jgi:hypothetical protein
VRFSSVANRGARRMADWLEGRAELPRGARGRRWSIYRLIELAMCVTGHDRHPLDEELDGGQWYWAFRARLERAGSCAAVPAQDLLDLLYWLWRADAFEGYGRLHEDDVAQLIAGDIRRRVETGLIRVTRA